MSTIDVNIFLLFFLHMYRLLLSKFVVSSIPKIPWQISFSTDIISCRLMNLTCSLRQRRVLLILMTRFAEDVAMNADGIGKLNLFNFKVNKKTGEQTVSVM